MEARLQTVRISPQKMRRIARTLSGKPVAEAEEYLRFLPIKSAKILLKLVRSAAANAEHNFEHSKENLVVNRVIVNEGITLRRVMPRARGRADVINKRTSHVSVFLGDVSGKQMRAGKKSKIETRRIDELSHEELREERGQDISQDDERGFGSPPRQGVAPARGSGDAAAIQKRGGSE